MFFNEYFTFIHKIALGIHLKTHKSTAPYLFNSGLFCGLCVFRSRANISILIFCFCYENYLACSAKSAGISVRNADNSGAQTVIRIDPFSDSEDNCQATGWWPDAVTSHSLQVLTQAPAQIPAYYWSPAR